MTRRWWLLLAFQEWIHQLKSCEQQILVWTDHKNLEYFTTSKVLSRPQARWSEFLAEFDFVVRYRPGNKNGKPDGLSRRWELRPEEGSEDLQLVHFSFKPGQLRISAMKATQLRDPFRNILLSTAKMDQAWLATRDAVVTKKEGLDPHFSVQDEFLLWKGRWYIPNDIDLKNMILHDNHDSKISGHFNIYKTSERLKHNYHWHRMKEDVKDYVRAYDTCQRDKPSRHR